MAHIVNARFTAVNGKLIPKAYAAAMSDVWPRVRRAIATRSEGSGREMAWLAEKLGCSIQRIKNWEKRGVPPSAYQDIADALGWSVDAVAGRAEMPGDPWPFELITRAEFDALSERQKGALEQRMREALGELLGGVSTPKVANNR